MSSSVPDRSRNRLILGVACTAHIVQDGLNAALYVLLPVLAQAFGLTYAQVGLVRAVNTGIMCVLELPSGILAERFGERRLLVFGLACAGAGYLLLSAAGGLATITACLAVVGMGAAFQHALSSSLVTQAFPVGRRRSALGLYNSSGDAGKLVFTGLFSLAAGAGLTWQATVGVFGIAALCAAGATAVILARVSAGARPAASRAPGDTSGPGGWGITDRTGFAALNVVVFLDTAVQAGFFTFIAFLVAERGVGTGLASTAIALTLAGGMFGKAGCGYLADRLGIRVSFGLVQAATAAGIAALLVVPTALVFFMLPVLGVFLQGSTSITYGAVNDYLSGEKTSRGFALIYSLSGLSGVAGPVLFGVIGDAHGLEAAMGAMIAITLLAVPPVLWMRREAGAAAGAHG